MKTKNADEVIEVAWQVFAKTPRWKRILIKFFWPEVMSITEAMKDYYFDTKKEPTFNSKEYIIKIINDDINEGGIIRRTIQNIH